MAIYDDLPLHPEYASALTGWTRIRDALAGERRVKSKEQAYLPKLDGQDPDEYRAYLERAVFFNATKRTLNGLLGLLFKRPPEVLNAPDGLSLKKITQDGQSLHGFSRQVAREALSVSRYGVLVEKPGLANPGPAYFVGYSAEDILSWRERTINGRNVLDQVALRETYSVPLPNGIGSSTEVRYRILELDENGFYHQRVLTKAPTATLKGRRGKNAKLPRFQEEIIVPMKDEEPLTFIPFYIASATGEGPEVQQSILEDIVDLNFSHYRSYADLEHGRHYTAMPTYYISAAGTETEYVVGPNRVWLVSPEDKLGILEFNGNGLKFLENACETKERHIAALGGKLIGNQRKVAAESSEAIQMRQESENSILTTTAFALDEFFTEILSIKVWWDGYNQDVVVEFNKDFSETAITHRELRAMQELWESKLLPKDAIYRVFRKAGTIPPEMTLEQYNALLADPDQLPEEQPVQGTTNASQPVGKVS